MEKRNDELKIRRFNELKVKFNILRCYGLNGLNGNLIYLNRISQQILRLTKYKTDRKTVGRVYLGTMGVKIENFGWIVYIIYIRITLHK